MNKIDIAAQGLASAQASAPSAAATTFRFDRRFWLILALIAVTYAVVRALVAPPWAELALPWRVAMDAGLLLVLVAPAMFFLYASMRSEAIAARDAIDRENATLHERLRAHDLNVRLTAALDMAEDEDSVMRIARQAMTLATDGAPTQMLLADSRESVMRHDLREGWASDAGRCFIERPSDCPAVRRGMGTVFEDSLILSACQGMRGPMERNCAAACTPITVAGTGVGVLRALGPAGDPGLYRMLQSLNTAAHHVGARLSVVRSISASAREAATDPLTGAANRRSGEARLAELVQQSVGYVLAMVDIDFFKKINDGHGHEVGDRALKLLVEVLRGCIRRDDLLCRYGGEEFLLVLPGVDVGAAVAMLQRCRSELPMACSRAGLPAFTISAGVADAPNSNPTQQMRAADAALYRAKETGRDRVLCASDAHVEAATPVTAGDARS
ncbi:MAG: GGDEF domain-containing protein [Dokdonella sp.]|nr:GGDEF domain-containing protein [Dokdonella sp.]